MRLFSIFPISGLAVAMLAHPAYAQHSGFWREKTPKGAVVDCLRVKTQDQLLYELQRVGWPMERTPIINFSTDDAIIIAPTESYSTHEIAFFGLKRRDGHNTLDWGWTRVPDSESGPVRQPDGSYMMSSGSTAAAGPQSIVVSMAVGYLDDGFVCTKYKPN